MAFSSGSRRLRNTARKVRRGWGKWLDGQGSSLFPLVQFRTTIGGVELSLVGHGEDHVCKMLDQRMPLCPHFLGELELLQNTIKAGDNVLDAGANIGAVALVLAKTQPRATIYCFEPDQLNFSLLNVNMLMNDVHNIRAFNLALGKTGGLINMYLSNDNFGDHRSCKPNNTDLGEESFRISKTPSSRVNPTEFLQQLTGMENVDFLDLLKIDTQGPDFEILSSCLPMLRKGSKIAIEFSPYHLFAHGTTEEDVGLLAQGFTSLQKINPIDDSPRLSDLSIEDLTSYFRTEFDQYRGYWDIFLTY